MTRSDWRDDSLAREWAGGDRLEPMLALPQRMTAEVLAGASPPVRRVLDVGSGPGGFLEAVLERCPAAAGTWTDISAAMQGLAEERLAGYSGRVDFRLLDATRVADAGGDGSFDAVITSRVSHHLGPDQLRRFYATAGRLVGPGGWIANLDHVSSPEPWAERLARARARMIPPNPSPHSHDHPHPTLEDHLEGLGAAGYPEVTVAWRAFGTVLILARCKG